MDAVAPAGPAAAPAPNALPSPPPRFSDEATGNAADAGTVEPLTGNAARMDVFAIGAAAVPLASPCSTPLINFCNPIGFSRELCAPIFRASTTETIVGSPD